MIKAANLSNEGLIVENLEEYFSFFFRNDKYETILIFLKNNITMIATRFFKALNSDKFEANSIALCLYLLCFF